MTMLLITAAILLIVGEYEIHVHQNVLLGAIVQLLALGMFIAGLLLWL